MNIVRRLTRWPLFPILGLAATIALAPDAHGQQGSSRASTGGVRQTATSLQLPTGAVLDPAERSIELGSMPLALAMHPRGRYVVVLLNGWRTQGIQVLERATGRIVQTVPLPAVFLGLAFSQSGDTLFVAGGYRDVIYELAWRDGRPELLDSISLRTSSQRRLGRRYPAGLALSPNGRTLYVAENLADSLAVVDIGARRVSQRMPLGSYPYGVVATVDGRVFASSWGDSTVSAFRTLSDGLLSAGRRLEAGRHPSALQLNHAGTRLFVASGSTDRVTVLDTQSGAKLTELVDHPPAGPEEGSTPNAFALSEDGRRLFVAEADNNAVAVFDLSSRTSGVGEAKGSDNLVGRVPAEWYPTALALLGDSLLVVSGKGRGTSANPDGPTPYHPREERTHSYTLGQLNGSLMTLRLSQLDQPLLTSFSTRVARANGWDRPQRSPPNYPPFEHVIYVIKENRTYDEVLGDLAAGDGDTSLVLFPRRITPNHHALAERFGIFDRFFVNAEVSPDGHNWSTAAYVTDYVEKTVPSHYSARGRTYDYEGMNRGAGARFIPRNDVSEPARGYLWDLASRAGITFRNYGEFVSRDTIVSPDGARRYVGNKPFLAKHTSADYPGFDLEQTDQRRMDIWLRDFDRDVRDGTLPRLEIVRLPNDHTAALKAGAPTPQAYVADNDLAFGRMIERLTRSPYWESTVVFVLEDDAQNGPDHVDSHRSELFVISAYNAPGVYHGFVNTTDVIATMAEILNLGSLSQFDFFGRPLRGIFGATPNLQPYTALRSSVDLEERNPWSGRGSADSKRLDLSAEDRADEGLFNTILWRALKGDGVPYPGARRAPLLEIRRAQ